MIIPSSHPIFPILEHLGIKLSGKLSLTEELKAHLDKFVSEYNLILEKKSTLSVEQRDFISGMIKQFHEKGRVNILPNGQAVLVKK